MGGGAGSKVASLRARRAGVMCGAQAPGGMVGVAAGAVRVGRSQYGRVCLEPCDDVFGELIWEGPVVEIPLEHDHVGGVVDAQDRRAWRGPRSGARGDAPGARGRAGLHRPRGST